MQTLTTQKHSRLLHFDGFGPIVQIAAKNNCYRKHDKNDDY